MCQNSQTAKNKEGSDHELRKEIPISFSSIQSLIDRVENYC